MQQEEPTLQDLQSALAMVLALTQERLERPPPKRRPKPSSRSRWEATHPVISFRAPVELRDQLTESRGKANLSLIDIMMLGLERVEQVKLIKVLKTRISQEENTSP